MFGVGLPELAVIFMVAAVVFGPDKLPDFARQAARMIQMLRKVAKSTQDDLLGELGPQFTELELRELDPRALIRKHILETDDDDAPDATATP